MNEQELLSEYTKRARTAGLQIDCLGSGDINSEIAIICEAPGENEANMKMPLVGGAGRLLWDLLRPYNITRTNCYVTNVCKRKVALSTKTEARNPVKKPELEHWEGLLEWELDQLPNLKYVVLLGNFALKAVLNEDKITLWRGSVIDAVVGRKRRPVKAVVNYNPAMILRNMDLEPVYKFDLAKLDLVLRNKFVPHKITEHINPTAGEALSWIHMMHHSDKPIAFDIEVLSNETACIGFANDAHEGYCINFRDRGSNRFTLEEECKIYRAIQELFLNPESRFVTQNGNFDCYWLGYKDRLNVPNIWFDTLLGHHTLYPRMPHNLGFLTSQYTTHPYYKDEGSAWKEGGDIDQFWRYNVKDCAITYAVHEKIHKELASQNMEDFFFNHVMRLTPHLVKMTVNGIKADTYLKDKIVKSIEVDVDKLNKRFNFAVQQCTGDPDIIINPRSPRQLGDLFFTKLGLIGRGASTNSANRQRMREHPRTSPQASRMLDILDEYKSEHKFLSVYATMTIDEDHRIRCEWKQFGTQSAPGRLSSASVMWGSGANLQNQPSRAYPMFIADDGYMFTYFDLSQAEARVVAYQWNVQGLIDTFEQASEDSSYDVHRGNAARIFKCSYDEIPKVDRNKDGSITRRFLGKRCVHGLNYRMQAQKLAEVCQIPLMQAHEAYSAYHQAFPEIQKAWADTVKTVHTERMLFTPMGRRMIFLERIHDEALDSIIAFVPQSTIGDKVASVIYKCHEDKEWPESAHITLNIHDALIAIHKIKDKDSVTKVMKRHAESPIIIRGHEVSIPTDFKHSVADEHGIHRWSTLK
tara:strand:+ start:2601 stop:5027 length:2427 start_codon:yes stop_codon:yes gene_type:complete